MKFNSYLKMSARSIKKNKSRFISLVCIAALGVGFLAGLLACTPSMKTSCNNYIDKLNTYDIFIQSTLGFSENDIKALEKLDGLEKVQGAYQEDIYLKDSDGEKLETRVLYTNFDDEDRFNKYELKEGRNPQNKNECILVNINPYSYKVDLNTYYETEDGKQYKVVGIATCPLFLHAQGEVCNVGSGKLVLGMFTSDENINNDERDTFTAVYAVGNFLNRDTFSDEYDEESEALIEELETFGKVQIVERREEIVNEAEEELAEGRAEYESEKAKALAKLADAESDLVKGERELEDGIAKIDDGLATIDENLQLIETQLKDAETQGADAVRQLESKKAELTEQKEKLLAAKSEIESGWAEYYENKEKAEAAFAKGEQELAEAEAELTARQQEIDAGIAQVDAGLAQLEAMGELSPEMEAQKQQLLEKRSQLIAAKTAIESGREEYYKNKENFEIQRAATEQQLADAQNALKENENKINDGIAQIDAAFVTIDENLAMIEVQLSEGKAKGNEAIAQLKSKKIELQEQREEVVAKRADIKEGWNDYYEGKREAEAEFAKAEKELADAQKEIDDIEQGQWYVNGRLDTQGMGSYVNDVEIVAGIAKVFPVFFFLVAALVVLTTMTRMIEEERMLVGTLKSLGYSNSIIRNYYLLYGFASCAIGSVIGLAIGFPLFPAIISNAYGMMYNVPVVKGIFIWEIAIAIVVLNLAVIMFTIIAAVSKELKEKPASLLQPKAPAAGKRILLERITPIWSRIKFTHKVTLRNLFRYKKRFLMTVVGIAGCLAMLVAGFGVKDSINDIVDIQYGELYKYDIMVSADENTWEDKDGIFQSAGVFAENQVTVNKKGASKDDFNNATLHVPKSQEDLESVMVLRERKGHEDVKLVDSGVVISEKMSEVLKLNVGDKVEVTLDNGRSAETEVTGICEVYIQNRVYMTPVLYEKLYDKTPEFTAVYGKFSESALKKQSEEDIVVNLMEQDNINYAVTASSIKSNFTDSMQNIDYIVMVLIGAAGLLTIIVLYNLTNINICERKKEIATLKVLGFYEKESARYIFREIDILAGIGILAGFVIGILFFKFILLYIEVSGMMFGRTLYPTTFIYSALIMIGLTIVVNTIMKRVIKKIDMVESMKANE